MGASRPGATAARVGGLTPPIAEGLRIGVSGGAEPRRPPARYGVFFATYFYQGLIAGFSLTALANHLAVHGAPRRPRSGSLRPGGPALDAAALDPVGPSWTGPAIPDGTAPALRGRGDPRLSRDAGASASSSMPAEVGDAGAGLPGHSLFAALLDTACDRMIMDHVPATNSAGSAPAPGPGSWPAPASARRLFGWLLAVSGVARERALAARRSGDPGEPADAAGSRSARPMRSSPRAGAVRTPRRIPLGRFLRRLIIALRRPGPCGCLPCASRSTARWACSSCRSRSICSSTRAGTRRTCRASRPS